MNDKGLGGSDAASLDYEYTPDGEDDSEPIDSNTSDKFANDYNNNSN